MSDCADYLKPLISKDNLNSNVMKSIFILFKVIALICISSSLLTNCTKNDIQNLNLVETIETNNFSNCDPLNNNNIYDSIGILHNILLLNIENNCSAEDSLFRVVEVADSILLDYFGSDISYLLSDSFNYIQNTQFIIDEIDNDKLVDWIDNLDVTNQQKENLQDLYAILFNYDATNLCEIIDDIKQYEADLLNTYTSSSVKIELFSASTARHSLYYWDARFQLESEFRTKAEQRAFWRKFFIAVCDVAGCTAGAIAGSATVVLAVASSIVAGVSTSVGAGKLWDSFGNP
jgi:hypothetical protein